MRSPGMASRAGLFALASVTVFMAHLCHEVGPAFPQEGPSPAEPEPAGIPDIYASLGLNLAAAVPFGEFSRNVDFGFGLTGDISFRLVQSGWLGLRIDGGAIWYGRETSRDLSYVSHFPLTVESTTDNYIAFGAIGPQLHFAGNPISARVYGLVGMSYLETRTSAKFDTDDSEEDDIDLGSHVHLSDWSPSLAVGGELRWVLGGSRDGSLYGLGFNLDWRRHGTTRYLVEGSITDVDGRTVFEPLETRVDYILVGAGFWFGTW